MEEYNHCPRCLSPWREETKGGVLYCLTRCGMSYYRKSDLGGIFRRPIMLLENILKYEDVLFWFLDTEKCAYRSNDSSKEFYLPWLKFDIEPSKLNLYLTFL